MLLLSPKKGIEKILRKSRNVSHLWLRNGTLNYTRFSNRDAENTPVQLSRSRLLPALSERHTLKTLFWGKSRYSKSCIGSPRLGLQLRSPMIQLKSELCVCVCVCVYMYKYIYIYIHTHIYICICVCVCVRARARGYVYTHTHTPWGKGGGENNSSAVQKQEMNVNSQNKY